MAKKQVKEKKAKVETPETKVAEISKEVVRVELEAKKIVVNTKEDYEKASIFLSTVVKPRVNRIKELVDFFNTPHKKARKEALEAMNANEALFAQQLTPLENIEATVKRAMGNYLRLEDDKARKEEARLAALRDKQNERREEKGQAPIAVPLPTVERSQATVAAEGGGKTTAKKVWKYEVVDINKVPRNLLRSEVKHASVLAQIEAGAREIDGLRIWEDFDISATAAK